MPLAIDRAAIKSATATFDALGLSLGDLQVYGESHPRFQGDVEQVVRLAREYFDRHPRSKHLTFVIRGGGVEYRRIPLVGTQSHGERLVKVLEGLTIEHLKIESGISAEEVILLVKAVHEKSRPQGGPSTEMSKPDARFRLIPAEEVRAQEKAMEERSAETFDPENLSLPEFKISEDALGPVLSTYQALLANVESGRSFDYSALKGTTDRVVALFQDAKASFLPSISQGYFDDFTFHHSVNVSLIATKVAASITRDHDTIRRISLAALLHDIGKTWVPAEILYKPGKLTPAEIEEMKVHPVLGAEILLGTPGIDPFSVAACFAHHINLTDRSYPKTSVPYEGDWATQLISVIDVYEALTAVRPYKDPLSTEQAFDCMLSMPAMRPRLSMVKLLYDLIGPYPVGAIVELSTKERAIVLSQNPSVPHQPKVRIVTDRYRNPLPIPWDLDLAAPPVRRADEPPVSILRMIIAHSASEDPLQLEPGSDSDRNVAEAMLGEDGFLLQEG